MLANEKNQVRFNQISRHVSSNTHCPLESCNATDSQPDGETFSKEEPGARLPIQPLLISTVLSALRTEHSLENAVQAIPQPSLSHPDCLPGLGKSAVSPPESSPIFLFLGIFQNRFGSESHEHTVSEAGVCPTTNFGLYNASWWLGSCTCSKCLR